MSQAVLLLFIIRYIALLYDLFNIQQSTICTARGIKEHCEKIPATKATGELTKLNY
jgi:hypothetical protein